MKIGSTRSTERKSLLIRKLTDRQREIALLFWADC
jgi:hypothetical protein